MGRMGLVVGLVAMSMALAACGHLSAPTSGPTAVPTVAPATPAAPSLTPIVSATPTAPATALPPSATPAPVPSATPTPALPPPDYATWATFSHPDYGFSFHHPSAWTLAEDLRVPSTSYGHVIWLSAPQVEGGEAVLTIGFKRPGEEAGILRTGVGAGELVEGGAVPFLGRDVLRQVLVAEGRHVTVLYYDGGEIARGEMVFTLSLDARAESPTAAALSAESEATVDWIVRSFAWAP
jgi:hypothetical protein